MSVSAAVIYIFRHALQPVRPFTWFGVSVTTLDLVAMFRLCLVLRQLKDALYHDHVKRNGSKLLEDRSFIRSVSTTLTVVYGGEAVAGTKALHFPVLP
jgi:hypothetical protein